MLRNSVIFHVLAAASSEDAEQYFQMARLRDLFSIDKATGSDLDARAAEIQPAVLRRARSTAASGDVIFTRTSIIGSVAIPIGTLISGSDAEGRIQYRTLASGSILVGNTQSAAVPVVCLTRGIRGNLDAGQIVQFVTRIPGATGVTNQFGLTNGRDRESDDNFRARLKAFIQSISRGTKTALEGFARNAVLSDGRRVLFARAVSTILPTGTTTLYIDDGTGFVEEYATTFIGGNDTLLLSALGGERTLFTDSRPIRDDGLFELRINAVVQVRGVDYVLDVSTGKVWLDETAYPTGLTAADNVEANYRHYIGLIQLVQKITNGDPSDPLRFPGVKAAGEQVIVRPPSVVLQQITATISVLSGYDTASVALVVEAAVQDYINSLDIGEQVIVAEIIQRAMDVTGMFNFQITLLSGAAPVDQVILETQVARITAGDISLI
jgi:uncharacterized phage protein gp47/JayE